MGNVVKVFLLVPKYMCFYIKGFPLFHRVAQGTKEVQSAWERTKETKEMKDTQRNATTNGWLTLRNPVRSFRCSSGPYA